MNIRKFIMGVVMAYSREVSEVFVPLFLAHVISSDGAGVSGGRPVLGRPAGGASPAR